MNFPLSDEQRMLVESVRSFVEQELYPHEAESDRAGEVSQDIAERITQKALELGFYAANLPESVGGGGLSYTDLALFERELGKASHALHGLVGRPTELLLACEGEQVERYLAPCVRGDKTECFALTEPGAGSDIMSMATRAVRDGDDYVINGSKHFISAARLPDFAIVFAVTGVDTTPKGERKRVTAFLLDRGVDGFRYPSRTPCRRATCLPALRVVLRRLPCRPGAGVGCGGYWSGAREQMAGDGSRLARRELLRPC